MRKKIFILCLFIIYGLIWTFIDLISYGYMQAKGQFNIIINAVPIEEVVSNPSISAETKSKILLLQEVRQYAIDSLGLNDSDNYRSYYNQHGKDILWNLSACEPYEFKPVEWNFPFLGAFSYKGFFDLEKAKIEQQKLIDQDFDTRIRTVSAWSTLGWLSDPILSNMLNRNTGSMAELIIHELTHSTIFVKDSLTYNENLASFIGEQGARHFLVGKYGKESEEYEDYIHSEVDYEKYTNHMLIGYDALDSLYSTIQDEPLETKKKLKANLIQGIVDNIDTISFQNKERFSGIFEKKLPNNAYFQSYSRYTSRLDEFEGILKNEFNNDLKAYILFLKEKWQ